MVRRIAYGVGACMIALMLAGTLRSLEPTVTLTGWFADSDCALGRAATGVFTATNPECSKTCLQKGVPPVFVSEERKALYQVKGYPSVVEDLGYHVEVTATLDESTKTITVEKVKRLEYEGAACGRPKKAVTKQVKW